RDETLLEGVRHQPLQAAASALAVRKREIVHVHADELVGPLFVEATAELLRVFDSLSPVRERVRDAIVQQLRYLADHLGPQVAPDDVAAERQRESTGAIGPPLAEIDDLPQPVIGVRELAFVNQKAGIRFSGRDELLDLVERD